MSKKISKNIKQVVTEVMVWLNLSSEEWESIPQRIRLKILFKWMETH